MAPSTGGQLRKVAEGALGRLQLLDPFEDLTTSCRYQARPHPGCVDEILATVEPHHQGINTQVTGNVPADNEFLPQVDPILAPQARSLAGLVHAVRTLRNRSFQTMARYEMSASPLPTDQTLEKGQRVHQVRRRYSGWPGVPIAEAL
jgi:hypothetical protein